MTSVLFGAKSSPCTALYIKDKNARLFLNRFPETANSLIENCYMDDYLESCKTETEASNRVIQAIEINKHANWDMHSWASNHFSVLNNVNKFENVKDLISIEKGKEVEKILGLHWLNLSDELAFKVDLAKITPDFLNENKIPTKREFLSIIMSVFDPLGFLTPFTIQSRILMQKIWTSGIGWDEKMRETEFLHWKIWLNDFKRLKECRIDRCYQLLNFQSDEAELHIFCDASAKAYSSVAYWRFALPNKTFHTSIIMSKSRIAPLKVTTIPRLELQAAILGVRLAKIISKEHNLTITKRFFWSDSEIVLSWIKKEPREFKMFVANRIAEINENSNVNEWKWVPTLENPADDGTRYTPNALIKGSRWLLGPAFLRKEENEWPRKLVEENASLERSALPEIKKVVATTFIQESWIDLSRFSSWERLLATIARVFDAYFKMKRLKLSLFQCFKNAKQACLKISQFNAFSEEIQALKESRPLSKKSRILSLNPFLDKKGILRTKSRLEKFNNQELDSFPIILDAKEIVSQLLIKSYHEKCYHSSHESVINELNQEFWILGVRRALRSLVSRCIRCKLLRAKPANPMMAALPQARLGYRLRPFSNCGLDYFGPMVVKIGRRREKRYGALFTCMTTRAIHVELAHSLSTDSAIMALKRFIARRGKPLRIYCDNGTNFRGMSVELKKAELELEKERLEEFTARKYIEWKFNPPSASHMGGAWERLIRSVKLALDVTLKDQSMTEETLLTALAEIEHCINSRPLTHVSVDPRDDEALTPNHFLLGTSSGEIRFGEIEKQLHCKSKCWRVAQHYADCFWKRWLREYLPTLIPRKKWTEKDIPIKVGDIVLILENNLPRNQWRKGVVTKVMPGVDGEVRVVELKTAIGTLIRPTRKLIRFAEVQNSEILHGGEDVTD